MNTKSAQRCAALLGLVLALAGCSSPKAPQVQTDPYAGGQTYPWALADTGKVQTLTAGSNVLQYSSLASASNAWGPIEQNTSNGDQAAGDGQPLTIGGKVYTQGFGTHAGSQMLFTLAPASNITCTTFTADVGVDDEVGSKGSVVFQVYADGVKKYDSGSLTGADAAKAVSVDVTGVKQLKLVVTDAGDGISYDHADWANPNVNCTGTGTDQAPAAPANLTATPAQSGFTLNWSASTGSVAGYQVSRASQAAGPFTKLTSANLTATTYTDAAAPAGVTSYYQVVAVSSTGKLSAPASVTATRPASSSTAQLAIQNLDILPGDPSLYNDRLVFSRLGTPGTNYNHDHVTLRLKSVGTTPLTISALPITLKSGGGTNSGWTFDPMPALPLVLAPGTTYDLSLKFIYDGPSRVPTGQLNIVTNSAQTPSLPVQLAGVWQALPENNEEPNLQQVASTFGYNVNFLSSGQSNVNQDGKVAPQGDEVLSAYWQRADESQPVTVRQIAAYHNQNQGATFSRYDKTTLNSSIPSKSVVSLRGSDAQTLLPRGNNSQPVFGSFVPTAGSTFGFQVDGEWSDARLNSQGSHCTNGSCAQPYGQLVRFYPIRDRNNTPIPNTYLMLMDYAGYNYDYNDNIYVISNIKPASVLINVGGPNVTDPDSGNVWLPDKDKNGYALFTPTATIAEGSYYANYPGRTGPIDGTTNPIYTTYRGHAPPAVRLLTFQVPIDNGTYQVKLHFADLYWNTAGQRVFDISAQGVLQVPNFDIIARAGPQTASVLPLSPVQVTDGLLTLTFNASVDFPSISGIEIVR